MAEFSDQQIAQIKEIIHGDAVTTDTLKSTQREFLQSAAGTATKIVEANIKDSISKLRDTFDEEYSFKDDVNFTNNLNQNNFDFCREMQSFWNRTDRAVKEGSASKAVQLIEKVPSKTS